MADERWSPSDVDLTTPSTARIYDYLLGGKDNYATDRRVAEELLEIIPEARMAARQNHAFIGRAVRHLARQGIRQFVDVGTKLPARGNVHEVAAEIAPDARVVFADSDPVVLAHARALLDRTRHTAVVHADVRHLEAISEAAEARSLLDPDEPVAYILDRVLHFIDDDAEATATVARLRDSMPAGSHLVFTHITQEPQPEAGGDVGQLFKPTSGRFWGRGRAGILSLIGGFDLVEPGLTYTPQWRPDPSEETVPSPERTYTLAGVGRKP